MLPWIRNFWNNLSQEDKDNVARQSVIICKHIMDNPVRDVAVRTARQLVAAYPFLSPDVDKMLDAVDDCSDRLQPLSDMEGIQSYFQQFAIKAKKLASWVEPVIVPVSEGGRKFLVNNGVHGQITVKLLNEDNSNYWFEYTRDGELIFTDWKLKKNSPRIIREL